MGHVHWTPRTYLKCSARTLNLSMEKREKHIGKYLNYKTIASEMGTKKRSLPTWCQAARLALSIIRKGFFFSSLPANNKEVKRRSRKRTNTLQCKAKFFDMKEKQVRVRRRVGRGGSKKNKQLLWVLRKAAYKAFRFTCPCCSFGRERERKRSHWKRVYKIVRTTWLINWGHTKNKPKWNERNDKGSF